MNDVDREVLLRLLERSQYKLPEWETIKYRKGHAETCVEYWKDRLAEETALLKDAEDDLVEIFTVDKNGDVVLR